MTNQIFHILFFLTILVFANPNILFTQDDLTTEWKLAKEKHDIKIYTRKVEGYKMKEFKAVTTIEATPERLQGVFRDVDNYPKWMPDLNQSKVIKSESEYDFYVYTESHIPWPYSNRDAITRTVLFWEGDTLYERLYGYPDLIAEENGLVRVPVSEGLWTFKPNSSGGSDIIYQYQGDPGGNIPGWIINLFIVDGPYKTLTGLKEYLQKDQ